MQTRRKIAQCVAIAMSLMGPLNALADPQDASQVSPLGDPAWVASLRGPDPSRPGLNIGNIESTVPRSGTGEKDRIPDSTLRRGDSTVRNGQVLNNGRVYLIGAERTTLSKAGAILLAPGRVAELGDLRVPFVRVYVAAPTGVALDVDQLVSKHPAIGMFNALFAPAPSREGEAGEATVASVTVPAASTIVIVSMKDEPASGASGSILAFATAPVTERSVALLPVPPANVEERSGNLSSIPPASIVDRSFEARVAAVEDRSAMLATIPPALIVERGKVAFAAPVVDKGVAATPLVPAPTEERVAIRIARAEVRQVPLEPAAVERAVEQIARIGKPVPGVVTESELVAAKNRSGPSTGVVQVALSTPVVVVSAKGDAFVPREPAQAPIKLAAVQKRLPSVMIDRKGGFFFM